LKQGGLMMHLVMSRVHAMDLCCAFVVH
jgi:hypothetical protein